MRALGVALKAAAQLVNPPMSYLALARKWRPRTFSQLVGQEHINKALIKSLDQQRLHHAYLFTGTRGVGKTSVARLMAKALNCEQGISATPCLKCETCLAIEQGRFIDLLEIDGASKTRVEDTRDLLENVQYLPTAGRYKIYLIDEVHMLSQHSFNALLKTLEEPPAHVKFLLATTDPQKLPVTVLSRCLQFNLKHLSIDTIADHLALILKEEGLQFEKESLFLLAKAAQGSMRDALSLLDQAIASSDQILKATEIKSILGYTQQDYAIQLLDALADLNAHQLIKLCREIAVEGGHFSYVLDELLTCLHQITVCQHLQEQALLEFSTAIKTLATQFHAEDIQLFYQIAIKGLGEIHLAPTLLIGFEMTMLRMFTFRPAGKIVTPKLAYESTDKPSLPILPIHHLETMEKPVAKKQLPPPSLIIKPQICLDTKENDWVSILKQLHLTGLTQSAAENTEMISKSGREITLSVAKGHQSLFTTSIIDRIEQALSRYYNETIKIVFNVNDSIKTSPAQKKRAIEEKNLQKAEQALENDPFLQEIKQEFSAEPVKNSIEQRQDTL